MKVAGLGLTYLSLLVLPIQCWSQQAVPGKADTPNPAHTLSTSAENAMQLLQRAEAEILSLTPAVGSTICLQVAQGYGKAGQREKETQLLGQCFRTTLLIQNDTEQRRTTQMKIAAVLAVDSPGTLDTMVGVAEPAVKAMVENIRLQKNIAEKQFDEALMRISNISRLPDFPYATAVKLMLALPPEREADRRAVFIAARENYRQAAEDMPRMEDLPTMIVRYWKHFPPELVSDAIDEVLKREKKQSEGRVSPSLTISTSQGEANFGSGYQYRLFQFLPVLQEVDPGKAKSLLRENSVLQSSPEGLPLGASVAGFDYDRFRKRTRAEILNDI
jgi:hypothetical protein